MYIYTHKYKDVNVHPSFFPPFSPFFFFQIAIMTLYIQPYIYTYIHTYIYIYIILYKLLSIFVVSLYSSWNSSPESYVATVSALERRLSRSESFVEAPLPEHVCDLRPRLRRVAPPPPTRPASVRLPRAPPLRRTTAPTTAAAPRRGCCRS